MKHKAARVTLGLVTALFILFGGLVHLHATTPHKCPKHAQSVACEHVSNAGDLHGPGEQSENMKHKQKAVGDIVGCGCFWECLFAGSF